MVPMLAITSSRDMPMPLSDTVMVRAALSKATRIFSSASPSYRAGFGERLEAQLVGGVGGVRDQLAQEDLLVAVQGVDHEVQQLLHLGLEAEGFLYRVVVMGL